MENKNLIKLLDVTRTIQAVLDLPELLRVIIDKGVEITGADAGNILLLDEDGKTLVSQESLGFPEEPSEIKVDEGIVGWVVENKKPCFVPDVRKDSRYISCRPETKSEMAVPLFYGEKLIGVLNVESSEVNRFRQDEFVILKLLASLSGVAIIYQEVDRQRRTIDGLYRVGAKITANIELTPVLREITKHLYEIVEVDIPLIYLYDQEKEEFTDLVSGDISREWKLCHSRKAEEGGTGMEAIKENRIVLARGDKINEFPKRKGVKVTAAIPLTLERGPLGILYLQFLEDRDDFTENEKEEIMRHAKQISGILEGIGFDKDKDRENLKEKFAEKITQIVEEIDEITKAGIFLIDLYDEENNRFEEETIFAELSKKWKHCKPRLEGTANKAINKAIETEGKDMLYIAKNIKEINKFARDRGVKSSAALALVFEGKPLGVIYMHFLEEHRFIESEKDAIRLFATTASIAVERAKSYQNLQILNKIGADIVAGWDIRTRAKYIAKDIAKIVGGGIPNIYLYYPEKSEQPFEFLACYGWGDEGDDKELSERERILGEFPPRADGIGSKVIDKGDHIIIDDVPKDPRSSPTARKKEVKTTACFPLKFEDKIVGLLYLHFMKHHQFKEDDMLLINTIANQIAIGINNTNLYSTQKKIQKEIQRIQSQGNPINQNLEIAFSDSDINWKYLCE